jgi:hypothetical protein
MNETVVFDGVESAIILRSSFRERGIRSFGDFSRELGYTRKFKRELYPPRRRSASIDSFGLFSTSAR